MQLLTACILLLKICQGDAAVHFSLSARLQDSVQLKAAAWSSPDRSEEVPNPPPLPVEVSDEGQNRVTGGKGTYPGSEAQPKAAPEDEGFEDVPNPPPLPVEKDGGKGRKIGGPGTYPGSEPQPKPAPEDEGFEDVPNSPPLPAEGRRPVIGEGIVSPTKIDWKAVNAAAKVHDRRFKELHDKMDAIAQKKIAVRAKIDRLARRLKHHKKHQERIKVLGEKTDERNHKNYLLDAHKDLKAKLALKEEARDKLNGTVNKVIGEMTVINGTIKEKQDEEAVLDAKMEKDKQEMVKLNAMMKKEDGLAKGVQDSQQTRLMHLEAKISFDRSADEAMTAKLAFETKQEKKLKEEMAKIVNRDKEISQSRDQLAKKSSELNRVEEELEQVKKTPCATKKAATMIQTSVVAAPAAGLLNPPGGAQKIAEVLAAIRAQKILKIAEQR